MKKGDVLLFSHSVLKEKIVIVEFSYKRNVNLVVWPWFHFLGKFLNLSSFCLLF